MFFPFDAVTDPSRLDAVEALLDSHIGETEEFDRLTRLAAKMLNVPTCLISLVTSERQEFKGACGLPNEVKLVRGTPLDHSICKLTVISGQLVSVENAVEDHRTADNPVVKAIGLRAYLGFPLMSSSGKILGAFCVIDYVPRVWSDEDMNTVRDFAALAVGQLEAASNQERIRSILDVAIHDLRTPLSGIYMASCLVRERVDEIPDEIHPLLEIIETSTAAAVKLVENLAKSDRLQEQALCENPSHVLSSVMDRLRASAVSKDMTLLIGAENFKPLVVDDWALGQMLENLISNSIKYSPVSSRIWVHFDACEELGHFRVRDEGPGFSKEDRTKMFQRYSRLSAMPTGGESATGLGLSIVKRLAHQFDGRVELVSEVGTGAEFRISFPLAKDQSERVGS